MTAYIMVIKYHVHRRWPGKHSLLVHLDPHVHILLPYAALMWLIGKSNDDTLLSHDEKLLSQHYTYNDRCMMIQNYQCTMLYDCHVTTNDCHDMTNDYVSQEQHDNTA